MAVQIGEQGPRSVFQTLHYGQLSSLAQNDETSIAPFPPRMIAHAFLYRNVRFMFLSIKGERDELEQASTPNPSEDGSIVCVFIDIDVCDSVRPDI
ncbi:MAG: hypothetical protein WA906_12270 [Pacificimonas sp.]